MKTFVIAEIGLNHGGNVERAKSLIISAKESGATAVKLQTYATEKRVGKKHPAFEILRKCELSHEQQTELKKYADSIGIEFFSTSFDVDSLKFLPLMSKEPGR